MLALLCVLCAFVPFVLSQWPFVVAVVHRPFSAQRCKMHSMWGNGGVHL
jgi:hypothetical protein